MTRGRKKIVVWAFLLAIELALLSFFFSFIPFGVDAAIGNPNATVTTFLEVGEVAPDVINVSLNNNDATLSLAANSTVVVSCTGVIRDYNGETTLNTTNATFYDTATSSLSAPDDNNTHYTNTSCVINTSFGSFNGYSDDAYTALANCTFNVYYYAVAGSWRCEFFANDSAALYDNDSDLITINQLLALGVNDTLNFGTVNATYVSNEIEMNVSNLGNTAINLSLEGYGFLPGDGNAMNCTLGDIKNISIEHEKYNLTNSNPGAHSQAMAAANYTNLTTATVVKNFSLQFRQNEGFNEAVNGTWWRIYVPTGVAGNCTGNIVFGATTANGV